MIEQKVAYDKLKGAIFGCVLGDALGLPAEGITKSILEERYFNTIELPHKFPVRGFPLNDWSDDGDQTVLVMRALALPDPVRGFARGLKDWHATGFPELGDTFGMGCRGLTWRVLKRPEFEHDPHSVAKAVVDPRADNGALMRTAPCAFVPNSAEAAELLASTTHADGLAVATCIAQSLLIKGLAEGKLNVETAHTAIGAALKNTPAKQQEEFIRWLKFSSLEDLELDSRDARSYTMKAFACSVLAFRTLLHAKVRDEALFKQILRCIVMEGGDTDTNAAIAGACLGAHFGYSGLPADWIAALPHREWLSREVDAFYAHISSAPAQAPQAAS